MMVCLNAGDLSLLPKTGGSYLLWLCLRDTTPVQIGKLGKKVFEAGWYAYAGSAFGPGGLAARILRHALDDKQLHWHIDYLRTVAGLSHVWFEVGGENREHHWARLLGFFPGARYTVKRFGASDCRCPGHLLYFEKPLSVTDFLDKCGDLPGSSQQP